MREFQHRLQRLAEDFAGKLTLALTDLTTGEHIGIGEDEPMPAASVIKLPILVTLYQAVDARSLKLNDRLRYDERHRSPGTGLLKDLDCGVEMSVRDAAELMITVSDNAAFNMIVDHLGGVDPVNAAFLALGLQITTLKSRVEVSAPSPDGREFALTTASEIRALLEKIARREMISPEACDDMVGILRRQRGRDKLSRSLPWNALNILPNPRDNWVASKDGVNIFNAVLNDAAIMHGPRGEVAIAAFTECKGRVSMDPNHEGSTLLGQLGELAWRTFCA